MTDGFLQLRLLKNVLLRQGALQAAVYWASPYRVFAINFLGGTVAGVIVTLAAVASLAIGAHRAGPEALLYVLAQDLLRVLDAWRAQSEGAAS
ncbi:MAG: hypothetical protein GIW99_03655 [Candidatus Eremiobacteraeota bacterium]|nr:hypothetical protein [Candidatus Eremiobacteraeota bacterium]MBC5826768.1 hypothetical protein [Candidatus Eremiobacteraeota bacterium]